MQQREQTWLEDRDQAVECRRLCAHAARAQDVPMAVEGGESPKHGGAVVYPTVPFPTAVMASSSTLEPSLMSKPASVGRPQG